MKRETLNLGLVIASFILYCASFIMMIVSYFVKEVESRHYVAVILSLAFTSTCLIINLILIIAMSLGRNSRSVYVLVWVSVGFSIPAGVSALLAWILEITILSDKNTPDVFFRIIATSSVLLIVATGLGGGIRRPTTNRPDQDLDLVAVQRNRTNQQTTFNTSSDPSDNLNPLSYHKPDLNPQLSLNHYTNPNPHDSNKDKINLNDNPTPREYVNINPNVNPASN